MSMDEQSAKIERRRSLDKMRSKLVSAETRPTGRPGLHVHAEPSATQRLTGAGMIAATVLLVASANVYSYLQRDALLTKVEPLPTKLEPYEPSKGWKADEVAIFWAYAAFAPAKFDERFGAIPEDKVLDRRKAAQKARDYLAKGGLNPLVEKEIKGFLDARKPRSSGD